MDVKFTFFHRELKEEVYAIQLQDFEVWEKEQMVCRLQKVLYGVWQTPQAWYEKINSYLKK